MEKRFEGNSGLKKIYSKVSADSAEDLIFRNHALFELGQLYFEKCDFPNAVDCLEKVKTEALQFHLYDNYFRSISYLLRIHAERMEFEKQESLTREAVQVGSSLNGYTRYLPKLHYNQGIAAAYKKQNEAATQHFVAARSLLQTVLADPMLKQSDREDSHKDLLSVRLSLAIMEKDGKNISVALRTAEALRHEIEELTHGEKAFETVPLYEVEASVLILEGQCYRELGEFNKALDRYWLAHGILKSHRNFTAYYSVLLGLGRVYLEYGNKDRAQIFFDLVTDAIGNLELNSLKATLDRISSSLAPASPTQNRLLIDRERKVVVENTLGEIHFERRFVLLDILYLLAAQPGKVFSKEELVDKIWRENYNPMIHDSKVYTSISRLRKLIEPDFKRPIYILNERDGYAFSTAVQLEDINSRMRKSSEALRTTGEEKL